MKLHASLRLRHVVVLFSGLALLLEASLAGAQVRAPGNEKQLPPSAQEAPPFQQSGGGGAAGPRIVRGTFVTHPGGSTESYPGYSVTCQGAGAGGESFDVTVTQFTNIVTGSFPTDLLAGQYLLLGDDPLTATPEGPIVQIVGQDSPTQLRISHTYTGSSGTISAKRGMLLFTTCDVAFDDAFASGAPTIVITARGNQPMPPETFRTAAIVAQIEQGPGAMSASGFQFFLMQAGDWPFLPGNTSTVDFIAIGN